MEQHRSNCPVSLGLEIFGDKWSLLIIRDIMFDGKRYFRELLQSEEKIASNILTDRLNMLESKGIISKRQDPDHKQKQIYSLTSKGIDLLPIMVEIGGWGLRHMPADQVKHKHAITLVKGGKDLQKEVKKLLVKEHLQAK
ncbi:MAG TPA: helix-turn-helix domain-containing protein [Chitinophaga sp.]|uniref:winged helix-turn-helix transcriptional regulator n=1 Tax=Chitinophaga sp. TaxID=1869181 RepID=UPI002BFBA9C9|nr:helix-turn-helix domain-containing protein [Chitinophaga sp.]HVI47062.1 helix-turn-helix domain-containing protein [Chitinophaga sp.]